MQEGMTVLTLVMSYRRSDSTVPASRADLYENPPKLPDEVLQQLLAEARQSLGSTAPSTSRDDSG